LPPGEYDTEPGTRRARAIPDADEGRGRFTADPRANPGAAARQGGEQRGSTRAEENPRRTSTGLGLRTGSILSTTGVGTVRHAARVGFYAEGCGREIDRCPVGPRRMEAVDAGTVKTVVGVRSDRAVEGSHESSARPPVLPARTQHGLFGTAAGSGASRTTPPPSRQADRKVGTTRPQPRPDLVLRRCSQHRRAWLSIPANCHQSRVRSGGKDETATLWGESARR